MSAKLIKGWYIPDSLFLPFSIHNVGEDAKTVLIVPGDDQIFTLVIKNCEQTIQTESDPHKVSCIKSKGSLAETIITSLSTIGRTYGGELVVFSSFRDCNVLQGIAGVKAIGSMQNGSKLIAILLTGGRHLQLEIYDGLVGGKLGEIEQCFDLSWEHEEFETRRNSQVHKVKTIGVTCLSVKLFRRLLNCKDVNEEAELILFTIDNGLYWLNILEGSYEIVTVKLYPAIILDFNYASSTGCFAVLVSNAVLHIYSISEDTNCLLLQEDKRHLGANLDSHLFISDLSTVLYSNGFQVIQLRYYYSELSKSILHASKEIQIAGVVGITYLDFARLAICITDNRLFYSIPIDKLTGLVENQREEYFELTHEILSQVNQMTCYLTNEVSLEKEIVKQTELEQVKIGILANAINKKIRNQLIKVELKWHKYWPNLSYSTLLLNENKSINSMLAQIDILLNIGTKEMLSHQRNWLLSVALDNVVTHIPIDIIEYVEECTIRLLAPIDQHRFQMHGIPHIEIHVINTVAHHQDRLMLDILLQIDNQDNFANLFEATAKEPKIMNYNNKSLNAVRDLIRHNEQLPPVHKPVLDFHMKGIPDYSTVDKLLNLFGITLKTGIDADIRKAFLIFKNSTCEVELGDRSDYRFKSPSPKLLYILKVLCSKKLQQKVTGNEDQMKAIRLQLMQCDNSLDPIASYYRQIRTSSDSWRMAH